MGYTVIKDGQRPCIKCGETKPVSEFPSYAYTTKQGKPSVRYDSRCNGCQKVRRKARYERDPEASNAVSRAYKAANRDELNAKVRAYRAANVAKVRRQRVIAEQKRRAQADLDKVASRELIESVLEESRFGALYLDAYSGELIAKPEVDHIVPLKHGGAHEYENLCVTSGWNNRSKNSRSLILWLAQRCQNTL